MRFEMFARLKRLVCKETVGLAKMIRFSLISTISTKFGAV